MFLMIFHTGFKIYVEVLLIVNLWYYINVLWDASCLYSIIGGKRVEPNHDIYENFIIIHAGIFLNGREFHILLTLFLVVRLFISTLGTFSSSDDVLSSIPSCMSEPHRLLLRVSNSKYISKYAILKPCLKYIRFTMLVPPINGREFHILLTLFLVVRLFISTLGTFSSSDDVLSSIPSCMSEPHRLLLRVSNSKYISKYAILKPCLKYIRFTMLVPPISLSCFLLVRYSDGPKLVPREMVIMKGVFLQKLCPFRWRSLYSVPWFVVVLFTSWRWLCFHLYKRDSPLETLG